LRQLLPELLTIKQTAKEIGRCEDFVRNEVDRKRLACHRFGNRIFISRDDLTAYCKRIRTPAVGEVASRHK
jgi:excisionase family DNA binding protein